jgi:hypothetical protein
MDKFSGNFGAADMEKAMKLARSDAGKQLIAMLNANGSQQLQDAMNHASNGDMAGARDILQQLLATEQAQRLLQQLQGDT